MCFIRGCISQLAIRLWIRLSTGKNQQKPFGGRGMAGLLRKAVSRLDTTPLEGVADTLAFDTIDVGKLANRLNLQQHGSERGKKEEPPNSSVVLDSVEQTIVAEIDEHRRVATDRVTRTIEAYTARLQAFDFEQTYIDVVRALTDAKSTFAADVHKGANTLYQKKHLVRGATTDVEEFRREHGLKRQAHLPTSRMLNVAVLLVLFLVEALLNASLFAGGLSGGLIEGIGLAVAVAFVNVVVGFGVGLYVVRFLRHRSVLYRLLAAVGLLVDLSIAAVVNLGLIQFRAALNETDPDAALAALFQGGLWQALQRSVDFPDFISLVLFAVGFVFHIIATIDGVKFDDAYPFYGRYWRKREAAENDYADTKEGLIAELTDKRDDTIEEMHYASRELASSRKIAARIVENRWMAVRRFETYLEQLQNIGNQLLMMYREANRASRSSPAPSHFDQQWQIAGRNLFPYPPPNQSPAAGDDLVAKTIEHIEKGIVDVGDGYIAAFKQYQQIERALDEGGARDDQEVQAA